MSNIAGKAYAMNVLTPMRPSSTWIQVLLFMASRVIKSTLGGLLGLKLIHFARWAIIRRDQWPVVNQQRPQLQYDYMLFLSNFNGTWDQYIDAFADGIPGGLDLFWYASVKYPHSIPITDFKRYITANQISTNYYYNATPGAAQRDIKAALRVRDRVLALKQIHARGDVAAFAAAWREAGRQLANSLASPGYAPIASPATQDADKARDQFVVRMIAKAKAKAAGAKPSDSTMEAPHA